MIDLANCEAKTLREDGEFAVLRVVRPNGLPSWVMISPVLERPAPSGLAKLENAFALREELDVSWAARPVELGQFRGRLGLVVEDPDGEFLDQIIDGPLAVSDFLRMAIGIASSLGGLHGRGLVHKDIKPANVIVNLGTGRAWLTGFSFATRLPRHRQSAATPETIAGTLAYMAPEQTGRMNRSIDSRSDLYSLGVTFYEMLVGSLPFAAGDSMEWIHCHIARRPVAPNLRRSEIPEPLSAIILKLLAKAPEERYQTAAGVEADLRRSLSALETHGRIESFPLGTGDVRNRLLVPEKLYGREKEIGLLLAAFDRVVSLGRTELVLLSGYSGIGKSSVVNELHRAIVPARGLFASGKFDQYQRDIPYATLAQALGTLVQQILGKSEVEVARWRDSLKDALDQNGQLIANLIPGIQLIIGKSPVVTDLPPQEAKIRFQRVLRRFIGVFARLEHPLTLFLDDLQWLDTATHEFIEYLVADADAQPILLVGAYRDNEVDSGHPFMRTLHRIRAMGAHVQQIVLSALELDAVAALAADSLHCHEGHSRSLARLVHEKTSGNPFFAIQFLTALADEDLITFASEAGEWTWDLDRILAKGYTDNVVELMVARLSRLPEITRNSLKHLACVGSRAGTATLNLIYGDTQEDLHAALGEAVGLGLLFRSENTYTFTHDRVQEAAYALVPEDERPEVHLRIGRVFASQLGMENSGENIFEVLNHLNRGAVLIRSFAERQKLAELNFMAGMRAKSTSAFASAAAYFGVGRGLLADDGWERCHALCFSLSIQQAEGEYLAGALPSAEKLLATLFDRAGSLAEHAAVAGLSVDLHTYLDRPDWAVTVGLQFLSRVGIQWSQHPTDAGVDQEYEMIWRRLGTRSIEELIDLPPLADAECSATLDVLTSVHAPANFIDGNLLSLVIGRMVILSLEYGNGDGSPLAYVYVGMILGSRFGNYRDGFRFGKLGVDLLERRGLERFKARVLCNFGNAINSWTRHVCTSCEVLRRAVSAAQEAGETTFFAYSFTNLLSAQLGAGDPLREVERDAESGLALIQKARFFTGADLIQGHLGLIRALRGVTSDPTTFSHAGFDEVEFERHLAGDPGLAMPACWYWIRKMQAFFFAGDHEAAVASAAQAESLLWTSPAFFINADYHFYSALARAAHYDRASAGERSEYLEALSLHRGKLARWKENCPENFADRVALVEAETARIEGRSLEAMQLYEQAIQSARQNGFMHHEGLAYELAARFYAGRGFEMIAESYLRLARDAYVRWGAEGKVRQLEQVSLRLRASLPPVGAPTTSETQIAHLDIATVVKTSLAISGEMVLDQLVEKLLRIAVEHAGANRGLLILFRDEEPRIEAEATTGLLGIEVYVRQSAVTPVELPESILNYLTRTRESVVLDDATVRNPYSEDEYVRLRRPKSVLCLPIIKQTKLIGALYLENELTDCAFTTNRVAVLNLLSSQAAISLENARLYAVLERENLDRKRVEEELRRSEAYLAEAQKLSSTGSFGWSVATDEHFWSDETYRIFEYEVSSPISMQMVRDRIHPEDISLLEEVVARASRGEGFDCEYRLQLPEGRMKQVHIVAHAVRGEFGTHELVGAVMDITATRKSEAALVQAQAELAHVTRVTTMGELAASIAHEVNQPITGVVINGNTCLRWLSRMPEDSPNLREARDALQRIIRDGNRAGEVVARIRALFKKTPSTKEALDFNETIREVVVLVRSEMNHRRVALRLELSADLPAVLGDRVPLQQVLLNLILNAIDAMATVEERPRELVVQTSLHEEREVLVTVRDSGVGLAPERAEDVFTAFHTTKPGGLGMGLSISRSIVENHSGRLWVAEHDGPGTSFCFTLPSDLIQIEADLQA